MKWLAAIATILALQIASGQTPAPAGELPKFVGREVTVKEAELNPNGFYPKGPATICVEGPPRRQCYTAPKDFGRGTMVTQVPLD